jgi:hypothetical protein
MAKNAMSAFFFSSYLCFSLKCKVQIDAYEVLVEANLPTRWVYQPLLTPLPMPQPPDTTVVSRDRYPAQLTIT